MYAQIILYVQKYFKNIYLVYFVHIFCATSGQTDEIKYIRVHISVQNSSKKTIIPWVVS